MHSQDPWGGGTEILAFGHGGEEKAARTENPEGNSGMAPEQHMARAEEPQPQTELEAFPRCTGNGKASRWPLCLAGCPTAVWVIP